MGVTRPLLNARIRCGMAMSVEEREKFKNLLADLGKEGVRDQLAGWQEGGERHDLATVFLEKREYLEEALRLVKAVRSGTRRMQVGVSIALGLTLFVAVSGLFVLVFTMTRVLMSLLGIP